MFDGLQEILYTLRQNKLRTLLTAFGVFWGIFMLILLLGFGRGMQNGIMQDFGSEVLDFIMVWSGDTSVSYRGMGLGRHIQLEQGDIRAITQQISGIRVISAASTTYDGTITFQGKNSSAAINGIPDEYFKVKEDIPFPFGRKTNFFSAARPIHSMSRRPARWS
jgi:putative ABC transport system permease protein